MIKELYSIVGILQGLCLLNLEAKAAVAQSWILEVSQSSPLESAGS